MDVSLSLDENKKMISYNAKQAYDEYADLIHRTQQHLHEIPVIIYKLFNNMHKKTS